MKLSDYAKYITFIADGILIVILLLATISEWNSRRPELPRGISIGLAALLVLNAYFVVRYNGGDSWISLWFQRKSLEERNKIRALTQAQDKSNQ